MKEYTLKKIKILKNQEKQSRELALDEKRMMKRRNWSNCQKDLLDFLYFQI